MELVMNKYQTPLTDELKETLPKEVWDNILEYISQVKMISNLIAPEEVRGFITDKPVMTYTNSEGVEVEYEDGRKEVDLVNPHILEDMDFFRERALFFERNGRYTNLMPNSNPKSDYGKFWKEELRRWKYGLVRPDGEWIPGELYFYWNYAPIWLVELDKETKGKKKGNRVRKFPKPWLGDYLFFHYVNAGKEAGKHGKLLKTRGVGFPGPKSEPILTPEGFKTYGDIKPGDYLIDRKGNPTKVIQVHEQGNRILYEIELKDGRKVKCAEGHLWAVYDKNKGNKNKNKLYTYPIEHLINKGLYWNNKNGNKLYKYYIPDLEEPVKYNNKNLKIPPYTLGCLLGDGSLSTSSIKIATIDDDIIKNIQKEIGDDYILTKDKSTINYLLVQKNLWQNNSKYKHNKIKNEIIKLGLNVTTCNKFIPDIYKLSSVEQRLELVKGLMDTDGSVNKNGNLEFSNSNEQLLNDLAEVLRSLGINCTKGLGRTPYKKEIKGKIYNIKQEYRLYIRTNQNLFKLSRKSKRVKNKNLFKNNPIVNIKKLDYIEECVCFTVDNDEHLYLTTDFIPTHNSFKAGAWSPRNMYVLPGSGNPNFHLASEKSFLSGDKGIWGKVLDTLDWIADHTPLSRMRLVDGKRAMEVQLGYEDEYGTRRGLLSSVFGISLKDNPDKARGIRGPFIHYEEDGLFPNLEKAWNVNRKAVEDGGVASGYMLAGGTGGTEGASFIGSEKLFYNPNAYNIYGIPNVFDRNNNGETLCGFFWGAYMNRNGCYDLDVGEPDVIKSLIEICLDRYEVKYSSSDANAITQKKAEEPITPQEAVMRTEGTVFPVADLKEYLEQISIKRDSFLAENYVGELVYDSAGTLVWRPNSDLHPLRSYDIVGNRSGCLEIYEMPRKNSEGVITRGRYIAGIDPVDSDTGESLFSLLILDTFTDRIVAEYSGRPKKATDAYEIALRALKFYNAEANYESNLKGLFSYFDKHNCLHYLADVPQILKDMDFVKQTNLYGNKAHPYSEKVYTPNGVKKWKDIKIGDKLFGTYGNITKVIDIPFDSESDVYEITLKDGRKVKATNNHLWNVIDWNGYNKILSTQEMLKYYYRNKGKYKEYKYYIPNHKFVDYNHKEVPINPYTLGLLLGDGSFSGISKNTIRFTSNLTDLETYKIMCPYKFTEPSDDRHMFIKIYNIKNKIELLGLKKTKSRTKFIPDEYKYNSIDVRKNILQGLMDTDGTVENGNPSFTSTSKQLANDVLEIGRSLGINGNLNMYNNKFGKIYKVIFYTNVNLFKLERKFNKQKITKNRAFKTAIVDIQLVGKEKSKCVTVDSKDNCYLIGEYITTHNSKGTHANKQINAWGRLLQADWMVTKAYGEDDDPRLNLHRLRGMAYIEECIKWNADGNFDRVSAGIMLFILREDRAKRIESIKKSGGVKANKLSTDPFFKKNYENKNQSIINGY